MPNCGAERLWCTGAPIAAAGCIGCIIGCGGSGSSSPGRRGPSIIGSASQRIWMDARSVIRTDGWCGCAGRERGQTRRQGVARCDRLSGQIAMRNCELKRDLTWPLRPNSAEGGGGIPAIIEGGAAPPATEAAAGGSAQAGKGAAAAAAGPVAGNAVAAAFSRAFIASDSSGGGGGASVFSPSSCSPSITQRPSFSSKRNDESWRMFACFGCLNPSQPPILDTMLLRG